MTNRKDQEKLQSERHQLIILELLRDEDNKYCVDCDAKGPRWASWNIGVFLCIRCAGIHRNLGVHISKVKSVNLDSWTITQLATMREMGNSRARAIYEARLPDNFRRPQTDSALETFIRSKYEQKRYIAQEYVPNKPDVDALLKEIQRLELATKKPRHPQAVPLGQPTQQESGSKKSVTQTPPVNSTHKEPEPDLLGLGSPASEATSIDPSGGIFASFGDAASSEGQSNPHTDVNRSANSPLAANVTSTNSLSADLVGLEMGCTPVPINPAQNFNPVPPSLTELVGTRVDKDAILALYQNHPQQQQPHQPTATFAPVSSSAFSMSGFGQFAPSVAPNSDWSTPAQTFSEKPASALFSDLQSFPTKTTPKAPFSSDLFAPSMANHPPVSHQMTATHAPNTTFYQPNQPVSSNFASWPEAGHAWPQSVQAPVSSSGFPFKAPDTNGQTHMAAPPWNTGNPGAAPVNQLNNGFAAASFFTPASVNTAAAAHQAYLSKVQSQLASLQLGDTVNNQQ